MSEAKPKRWRLAAAVVVGGGLLTGGWIGYSRPVTAEPAPPFATLPTSGNPDDSVWQRSATPPPRSSRNVARSASPLPAIPPGECSECCDKGGCPSEAPLAAPLADSSPRPLEPGVIRDAGKTPLPAIPKQVKPAPGDVVPAATMELPAIPPVEQVQGQSGPSTALPFPPVAPVTPVLPPPAIVTGSGDKGTTGSLVPPPVSLTPAPSPEKSMDSPRLTPLAKPNSDLPGANAGTSVKMDQPSIPVVPVVPTMTPSGTAGLLLPAVPTNGETGSAPGNLLDRSKPGETIPRDSDKFTVPFSSLPSEPRRATPGDSTMRNIHQSIGIAILGGAILAPSSTSAAPFPVQTIARPVAADTAKGDLDDVKKQVEETNKKLGDIQKQLDSLTELLKGRRDPMGVVLPSDRGLVTEMKELRDKLDAIQKDLGNLKTQSSSSLRPSTPVIPSNPIVEPKSARGIVRIVNEYPIRISMAVNGGSYWIDPGKTRDVEVPVGEFTYQLLESGAAPTRSFIEDKKTVILKIK
jgi:hypothetical protein